MMNMSTSEKLSDQVTNKIRRDISQGIYKQVKKYLLNPN